MEEEKVTHFSILAWKNPMDRGACQSTVHGAAKELGMTGQLSMHEHNNGIVFQGIPKERHDQSTDLWKRGKECNSVK